MNFGIIGAGRVGCALAIGLKEKGYAVSGIFSRSCESFEFLNDRLGLDLKNELAGTVKKSDIIFITVPDSEIEKTANAIASSVGRDSISDKVFFHCSGALTSDALSSLQANGAYTASFHPCQTFADKGNAWEALDNIYFGFEGCQEAKKQAETVLHLFNGKMLVLKKEDKPLYHAAASIISNYMVTLSFIAGNLLEKIGIEPAEGLNAFSPLLGKTLDNIKANGSINALTGAVSRGDAVTVAGHIRAFEGAGFEYIDAYKKLGLITLEIALKKGTVSKENEEKLYEILR